MKQHKVDMHRIYVEPYLGQVHLLSQADKVQETITHKTLYSRWLVERSLPFLSKGGVNRFIHPSFISNKR
jgi:hypothetical protein